MGCATFALQPPPAILVDMNWHLGPHAAAPMLWSALMSVCVASFGANAHAAVDTTGVALNLGPERFVASEIRLDYRLDIIVSYISMEYRY